MHKQLTTIARFLRSFLADWGVGLLVLSTFGGMAVANAVVWSRWAQ